MMMAAHEKRKAAVAELHDLHLPDHVAQEIRGKLEDSTRRVERLKHLIEDSHKLLGERWNAHADLLRGAISGLDDLERKKQ